MYKVILPAVTLIQSPDKPQSWRGTWTPGRHVGAPFVSHRHEENKYGSSDASFQLLRPPLNVKTVQLTDVVSTEASPSLQCTHTLIISRDIFTQWDSNYDLSRQVTHSFPQIYVVCDLKRQCQLSFYLMCQNICLC